MFDHEQISNEAFAPLDFKTYIEYYLIPWVAMHLISKDLGCSLEAAYEDMIASADSGVACIQWVKKTHVLIESHGKLCLGCRETCREG